MRAFDYIVDCKGGGDYRTLQEAIDAMQRSWWRRWLHRIGAVRFNVRPGVYDGNVSFSGPGKLDIRGEGDKDARH